jgi:hypothetical protein
MNIGDLRTKLKARLNRSDCTDALALDFIAEAVLRVDRELRSRLNEAHAVELLVDDQSRLEIPDDYLEMIALAPEDATKLPTKRNLDAFLREAAATTSASDVKYTRRGGYWYLTPAQEEATPFILDYFAGSSLDASDTASTAVVLDQAWDLYLYASLSAAGSHFAHDNEMKWESQYVDRLNVLNTLRVDQDLAEGPHTVEPGTSTEY